MSKEKLCSYCRQAGHHRGKCPLFKADSEYIENFRELKKDYERKILEEFLPIGSIIRKTNVTYIDKTNITYGQNILCVPVSYKNLGKYDKPKMELYSIDRPTFTSYDDKHRLLVHRIFKDRKWSVEEEKRGSSGVYLQSITGERMQKYNKNDGPEYFTFNEINYDIRRTRITVIS